MSEITTGKTLNLYQLGQEIGGDPSFRLVGPSSAGQYRLRSDATQGALEAAVAAHVANPSIVAPAPPPTVEETNEVTLNDRVDQALATLQTLIDAPAIPNVPAGTLTTATLTTVVRALRDAAQQNRDGAQQVARTLRDTIRLVRGDFGEIDPV